jgi:hypothetical protein
MTMAQTDDGMIAALLRERDGYVRTGRKSNADLVTEQLRARGHEDPPDPATEPPRDRSTPPRRTAEGRPPPAGDAPIPKGAV